MATLEKLGELKAKGILTQEEFDAKKAELLKKLRAEPRHAGRADAAQQRTTARPAPAAARRSNSASAQSTHAVCPYCQSTVVRQGETLARIGKMAELFDDFSPLQLMAAGRSQDQRLHAGRPAAVQLRRRPLDRVDRRARRRPHRHR